MELGHGTSLEQFCAYACVVGCFVVMINWYTCEQVGTWRFVCVQWRQFWRPALELWGASIWKSTSGYIGRIFWTKFHASFLSYTPLDRWKSFYFLGNQTDLPVQCNIMILKFCSNTWPSLKIWSLIANLSSLKHCNKL